MTAGRAKDLMPGSAARYLLCSDLDGTLIPNGEQPESAQARPRLRQLVREATVCLVYVTGRNQALVEQAVEQYGLPWPDAVIGDVGTRIWSTFGGNWQEWDQWRALISHDWDEHHAAQIIRLLEAQPDLQRQPESRQSAFKLSYYCTLPDLDGRCRQLRQTLAAQGLELTMVASIDELTDQGLIDILPAQASKQSAIEMLMSAWGFQHWNTVCAGDSGNDLPFLTGALQAVLVANASADVRERALQLAADTGQSPNLYLAHGGFLGMNGHYAAGVLEGMAHYLPEARAWML